MTMKGADMKTGAELIAEERTRQVTTEGYDASHDQQHTQGELAWAAVCYAAPTWVVQSVQTEHSVTYQDPWPWYVSDDRRDWKRKRPLPKGERVRELVKAGALIAAEIDRINAVDAGKDLTVGPTKAQVDALEADFRGDAVGYVRYRGELVYFVRYFDGLQGGIGAFKYLKDSPDGAHDCWISVGDFGTYAVERAAEWLYPGVEVPVTRFIDKPMRVTRGVTQPQPHTAAEHPSSVLWVGEHRTEVWHVGSNDGWRLLCGASISGSPPVRALDDIPPAKLRCGECEKAALTAGTLQATVSTWAIRLGILRRYNVRESAGPQGPYPWAADVFGRDTSWTATYFWTDPDKRFYADSKHFGSSEAAMAWADEMLRQRPGVVFPPDDPPRKDPGSAPDDVRRSS